MLVSDLIKDVVFIFIHIMCSGTGENHYNIYTHYTLSNVMRHLFYGFTIENNKYLSGVLKTQ